MKILIEKELKEIYRWSHNFWIGIVFCVLLVASLILQNFVYHHDQHHTDEATELERSVWENQGDKNPHSAAHYGTYLFKDQHPLSILDPGLDPYLGNSIFVEAHNRHNAANSHIADSTFLSRFTDFTPVFILLYLLPLIIVIYGHNIVSKEYELGTAQLLKSEQSSSYPILLSKWIALFLPMFILLVASFLILTLFLILNQSLTTSAVVSLFMLFVFYGIYISIFTNLVLIMSSLSKSSGVSLIASLFIWICFIFVIPKIAAQYSDSRHPYPDKHVLERAIAMDKKNGIDGHGNWGKQLEILKSNVLEEYGVDSLHQLPFNFDAYRMQKSEEFESEIYKKHYGFIKDQFQKQVKVYDSFSILSPFISIRFLSMSLARTDYFNHWKFEDDVEHYRIKKQAFLNDYFGEHSTYGDWGYKAHSNLWRELPKFEFQYYSLNQVCQQNALAIIILILWYVVSAGLIFIKQSF